MVDAAIQESIQTQRRVNANGASGSSHRSPETKNPLLARRAAAVERRITRANRKTNPASDEDAEMGNASDEDVLSSSSESDVPLSKKGKGKSKAKPKASSSKKKNNSEAAITFATFAEMRKKLKEDRARTRAERDEARKEERLLRQKLGRKLTMVGCLLHCASLCHLMVSVLRLKRQLWHCTSIIQNSRMSGVILNIEFQ